MVMRRQTTRRPAMRRLAHKPTPGLKSFKGFLFGADAIVFADTTGAPSKTTLDFFGSGENESVAGIGRLGPIFSNMPAPAALPKGWQFQFEKLLIDCVPFGAAVDPYVAAGVIEELRDLSNLRWKQETFEMSFGPFKLYPCPSTSLVYAQSNVADGGAATALQAAVPMGSVRDATPFDQLARSAGQFALRADVTPSTAAARENLVMVVRAIGWGTWTIRDAAVGA